MWKTLREWWQGKKLTAFGVFLFVIAVIPRWISIGRFWYGVLHWGWLRVAWLSTDWGRVFLIVVGLVLIAWDQYRRKKSTPYDLKTLKGRTLKLRDDLKAFVDSFGAKSDVSKLPGEDNDTYLQRSIPPVTQRAMKMVHGYELRFPAQVGNIYHEFGERGVNLFNLAALIERPYRSEEALEEIIKELSAMADLPEAIGEPRSR